MEQKLSVKEATLGMKEQQLFSKNQEIINLKSELRNHSETVTSLMADLRKMTIRANDAERNVLDLRAKLKVGDFNLFLEF